MSRGSDSAESRGRPNEALHPAAAWKLSGRGRLAERRRPAVPRAIVLCLIALSLGCGATLAPMGPFPGYLDVVAGPDCPPAGSKATTLVLRPAADSFDALGPQLRLAVWRDDSEVSGRTFASTDRPATGGGFECSRPESCAPLTDWRVQFDKRQRDGTLAGVLTVRAADGVLRRGRFQAVWHSRVVFCI